MVWTPVRMKPFYQPFGIGTARHCAGKSDQLGATTAHRHHIGNRHPPLAGWLWLSYRCIGAIGLTHPWRGSYDKMKTLLNNNHGSSRTNQPIHKSHGDMHDLTDKVNQIVKTLGSETGMAHVFNIGGTAAIGTLVRTRTSTRST